MPDAHPGEHHLLANQEIERVVCECDPEKDGVDVALIEHISPIEWDNVLPYGEYVINRRLIQAA